jgi:hypothetical protein
MYANSITQVPYLKAVYSTHVILVDATVKDHSGNDITKEEFEKIYGTKCNFCDADVDASEGGYLVNSNKSLLCKSCAVDSEIKQYLVN